VTASRYPKDEELALKYAQAAYEHTTEGWLSTLNVVQDRLAADSTLIADLNNAALSFAERQERLDALLPSDARLDVKNFLYVLLRDGQIAMLSAVIRNLTYLATRGPEAHVAHITSAVPLTPEEEQALRQRIHDRFGSDVDLDFRIDSSILGGIIVQVGDKIVDGSVAGKLNALHDRLAALR
jgi:F-type H+-transporting ATPase subunit delta